jgi:hypothetical protein
MVPLLARERSLVVEGLIVLRAQFPMRMRGIDSDNDGAIMNETPLAFTPRGVDQMATLSR